MSLRAESPTRPSLRQRAPGWLVNAGVGVILVVLAIAFLFPMVWMGLAGLKSNSEIYRNTWGLPESWQFSNFVDAWNSGVGSYLGNSTLTTILSIVGVLVVSLMAAYGLTRLTLPYSNVTSLIVIAGLLFPPTVALVPLANLFQTWQLQDTLGGVTLLYIAYRVPFTTFLIATYMVTLPSELEEAAVLDGASRFQILVRVIGPLCQPILVSAAILQFLFAWNEFTFALLFLDSAENKTLAVGLVDLQGRAMTNFPVLLAGMTIASAPLIVAFIVGQRQFVAGLSAGAGK